jgi:hypothetical protein
MPLGTSARVRCKLAPLPRYCRRSRRQPGYRAAVQALDQLPASARRMSSRWGPIRATFVAPTRPPAPTRFPPMTTTPPRMLPGTVRFRRVTTPAAVYPLTHPHALFRRAAPHGCSNIRSRAEGLGFGASRVVHRFRGEGGHAAGVFGARRGVRPGGERGRRRTLNARCAAFCPCMGTRRAPRREPAKLKPEDADAHATTPP